MSDFVLGDDDCKIQDVVNTIFESRANAGLIEHCITIARDLGVPEVTVAQLVARKRNYESIHEIWSSLLTACAGAGGNNAKLSVLINILKKPNYSTRDAADKLQARFVTSTSNSAGSSSNLGSPGGINLGVDRYVAHINTHLLVLIRQTIVNSSLITYLVSVGLFSDDDVADLDAIANTTEKARKFYNIIKTKTNFYHHLLAALTAGAQSGALATLNRI